MRPRKRIIRSARIYSFPVPRYYSTVQRILKINSRPAHSNSRDPVNFDTIIDFTGDLFVVVFSMDCRESFEEAIRLREAILETKVSATQSATKSRRPHYSLKVPMVIVGNKCDKDVKYVFFDLFDPLNVERPNRLVSLYSFELYNYFSNKFSTLVHRTVTVEEAEQYCVSQDECCIFVEASAKRNYHMDELFYQLFVVAGLPLEMAPNHHRKVPLTFGSPTMFPPSQVRIIMLNTA